MVEEKATLVSLREDGNMKNMDDKGYYFHSQSSDPWEVENIALADEDCKMKDTDEGK